MKKRRKCVKAVYLACMSAFVLAGCSVHDSTKEKAAPEYEQEEEDKVGPTETEEVEEASKTGETAEPTETGESEEASETGTPAGAAEPEIVDAEWSEYFNGLNGAAVIYDVSDSRCTMYHRDLALTRRSPCSTFKIISSLAALENGIMEPENSTRTWSGEEFWNEDWNKDIDFQEAFRSSCVWYFREVINEIGEDVMQAELDRLSYGNCDISDWEGRLNTNNNNRALTGFWIESSLLISPKEQALVMELIFGENSDYSEETRNELKQVMLAEEQSDADISIYGKTGMGKADGVVVDAWFTGFAESTKETENMENAKETERRIYFCVYLGKTDGIDVSSARAKEIAVGLVSDYCAREHAEWKE